MLERTLITLAALFLFGCGNGEQEANQKEAFNFPVANEENCKKENIAKIPKQYAAEFSSMCLRQGKAKPSEPKEW